MTPTHTFSDDSLPAQPEVLLVDDDEVNLLLIALALRERGFRIIEAGSGERALAMLAELTPDIIVLDAMMPGLDGFDTCRAVRRLPGYENVPVLMLTGLDDDASITRAYQAGAGQIVEAIKCRPNVYPWKGGYIKETKSGNVTERKTVIPDN